MVFITCGMGGGTGTWRQPPLWLTLPARWAFWTVDRHQALSALRAPAVCVRLRPKIEELRVRSTSGHYPQRASEAGHRSEDHLCQCVPDRRR